MFTQSAGYLVTLYPFIDAKVESTQIELKEDILDCCASHLCAYYAVLSQLVKSASERICLLLIMSVFS